MREGLTAQVIAIRIPVDPLQLLHTVDVGARLGELDPLVLRPPLVDVALTGVVGRKRELLVATGSIREPIA